MTNPASPLNQEGVTYGKIVIETWCGPGKSPECRVDIPSAKDFGFAHLMIACEHLFQIAAQRYGKHPEHLVKMLLDNAKQLP